MNKLFILGVLFVVGCSGKDLSRDYWKRTGPSQSLDETPAGKPRDADVLDQDELQAEIIFEYFPKLPFNFDKDQKVAAVRLLKSVAKPILKSRELRDVVNALDQFVLSFKEDEIIKARLNLALQFAEDIYKIKDPAALREFVHEIFTIIRTTEQQQGQARTIGDFGSLWESWFPVFDRYMVAPTYQFLIQPLRSYVGAPITAFASRIGTMMGIDSDAMNQRSHSRWAEGVSQFIDRASQYSRSLKNGVQVAAALLESQEPTSCSNGPCGVEDPEAK